MQGQRSAYLNFGRTFPEVLQEESVTAPSVWRYSGQALVTVRSQSEFWLPYSREKTQHLMEKSSFIARDHIGC